MQGLALFSALRTLIPPAPCSRPREKVSQAEEVSQAVKVSQAEEGEPSRGGESSGGGKAYVD